SGEGGGLTNIQHPGQRNSEAQIFLCFSIAFVEILIYHDPNPSSCLDRLLGSANSGSTAFCKLPVFEHVATLFAGADKVKLGGQYEASRLMELYSWDTSGVPGHSSTCVVPTDHRGDYGRSRRRGRRIS